jgi:hypothetical protein
MGGGALAIPVLPLVGGIVAFFTALAFLLLRVPISTNQPSGERAEPSSEPQPTIPIAGLGFTLIAAVGIGALWFFVWKMIAMTLQSLFVSKTTHSSHAFPVVPLSFAISIVAMCVVVLLIRHANSRHR